MTIRKVQRHGATRLVVDIAFTKKDGKPGRYRRDAEVQTMAAARAEERRILGNIATYGEPHEPSKVEAPTSNEVQMSSVTFNEVVEIFRKGKAITKLKATTRAGYEEILTGKLIPEFGSKSITSIDFASVTALDAKMAREKLSLSRRRNVAVALR